MGIRKEKRKNGMVYVVDIYREDTHERIRQVAGTNRRDAERLLAELKFGAVVETSTAGVAGPVSQPEILDPTFSEAAKTYLAMSETHKRSYRDDVSRMKVLTTQFGDLKLTQVSPRHLEALKNVIRERGSGPACVNRHITLVSAVYRYAQRIRLYDGDNPAKGVPKLSEPPGRIRYLSPEEIGRLQAAASPELWQAIRFALCTGLRRSEQFNLRWSDVDFDYECVHVTNSKNGSRRTVVLSGEALAVLRERHPLGGEYVFKRDDGHRADGIRRQWETARRKAKVADVRWHDLRHSFASHAVMNGVNVFALQDLLGHKTLEMTRRYSHLADPVKRAAVKVMDGVLERARWSENSQKMVRKADRLAKNEPAAVAESATTAGI